MDNLQPLMLNDSNNGGDWREHQVTSEQIYKRQARARAGSATLFGVIEDIIQRNIEKGNIRK